MSRPTLKAIVLLAVVFLLGVLAGTGGVLAYSRRGGSGTSHDPAGRMDRMRLFALSRALDLDDSQEARIESILARHRQERRDTWESVMSQCGAPLRLQKVRLDTEIRATLNGEQQKKFDVVSREQDEQFWRGRHRGPR